MQQEQKPKFPEPNWAIGEQVSVVTQEVGMSCGLMF